MRAEYGADEVRLTGSGTAALALAMRSAARDGTRPKIAMPAWACYDLMTAADIVNAEVVLYDLDPATLAPAPVSFGDALRHRPDAVVIAHWFGLPISLAPLQAAVRETGALLIEDAAQGVGGSIGGRPLGSFGDFAVLSFGRGKGRTGGAGGALLANNADAATRLRNAAATVEPANGGTRALAALAAQWVAGRPSLYVIPSSLPFLRLGETVYHLASPIREMPESSAAVVLALWSRAAQESDVRRATAARWARAAADMPQVAGFVGAAGGEAGWLRFPLMVNDSGALRDAAARHLGIMSGYEGTLAALPLAPGRVVNGGPWPGAVALASRLRTLPTHSRLGSTDIAAIVQLLGGGKPRRS